MKYSKPEENNGNCLQCGTAIYGRKDKKFCSEGCKNHYHNAIAREINRRKTRIISALNTNYEILCNLLKYGLTSCKLEDLRKMGFKEEFITGYRRKVSHHSEHSCFDIRYFISESKVFGVRKDEVNTP